MNVRIETQYQGMTIKDYLRSVHGFSRRLMRALKTHHQPFEVNGMVSRANHVLNDGDWLKIRFPKENPSPRVISEHIPLDIVYEDDTVLIINKPAQMAVMPSPNQPTGTLANGLSGYYEQIKLPYAVHIVTRLDKDTSGLVLVAKTRFGHMSLSTEQRNSRIKRSYYAVTEGIPSVSEGILTSPIGRKEESIIERTVRKDGQCAITHFTIVQHDMKHAFADVQLETGRTHQIRVHFAHEGLPLLGDTLYGGNQGLINRQALHCYHLAFKHPLTHTWHKYECRMPDDMARLVNGMYQNSGN